MIKLLISVLTISIFAFFAKANMLPDWVHQLCSEGYDKHAHALIFCILQLLCAVVFPKISPLSIAAFLTIVGTLIEIGQHYYTSRTGDVMDVFANMAGLLFALFLTQLFNILKFSL